MKHLTLISQTNSSCISGVKLYLLNILFLLIISNSIFGQLTIHVIDLPDDTQITDEIFLAGNINGWNPGDSNYKLNKIGDKNYQITIKPQSGKIEYKFTRGSWATVESNVEGGDISNRTIEYDGSNQTIKVSIAGWKEEEILESSAAENVSILKEDFLIPGFERERKIWIYLPPDYNTSQKIYPVLYMHDGQNLFDVKTSFSGEWNVDESLNNLFDKNHEGVIVIGIENGGSKRIEEYTPWANEKFGGGQGAVYVDFIASVLKPYVDAHYRTKPDRLNTGIMGSSLGGLISFYAGIKHQDVFSKIGVFSPSFWFSPEVFDFAKNIGKREDMKIYFLGGELEGEFLKRDMKKMVSILQSNGFKTSETIIVSKADGDHNETFWAREFSDSFKWLFW